MLWKIVVTFEMWWKILGWLVDQYIGEIFRYSWIEVLSCTLDGKNRTVRGDNTNFKRFGLQYSC